jgi:site-specific DNA-methyltransferase (adenine-specific)
MISKTLFSHKSDNWTTPQDLYNELNKEFNFNFDPCPLNPNFDGLNINWKERNFINPPYSKIALWVEKAERERER